MWLSPLPAARFETLRCLLLSLGADMRRRDFLSVIGGAAAAWPVAAQAQPAMPVIGFLAPGSPASLTDVVGAVRQGLSESGFVEGRNVAIEFRYAGSDFEQLPTLGAELVSRRV